MAVVLGLLGVGVAQADPLPPAHRYYAPVWFVPAHNKLGLSGGTPAQADALGANWLYDWTTHPDTRGEYVEAVPMIWGDWGNGPVPQVGGSSPWLMGFNEPDLAIQANLTPERAAVLWRQIEQAYPWRLLVAPAPSDRDIQWLQRMRDSYIWQFGQPPRFDALAAHCYLMLANECIRLTQQYVSWAQVWGVEEVWVTEYAFLAAWTPGYTTAQAEARTYVNYMQAEQRITRYAPFVAYTPRSVWYWPFDDDRLDPSLFRAAGSLELTDVGRWYARR